MDASDDQAPGRETEAGLWRDFRLDRFGPARQRIFEVYLPFSRKVAARVRRERAGPDLDAGDLRQYAAEGLLQAIDRFDPDRGSAFEDFAARRIAGRVIDGIGESTELRRQSAFRNRIRAERARSLTPDDAARLSTSDALQALTDLAVELALGFMLEDAAQVIDGELQARGPNAYESLAWVETTRQVALAIAGLPDQDQTVVRLHYLEGLEFARIADTLGLTRGRISQIHAGALQRLRRRLPPPKNLQIQR